MLLYHGTTSTAKEGILLHGLSPESATHELTLLHDLEGSIENFVAPRQHARLVESRIAQRLTLRNLWSGKISFVEDYGIARAWALDHPHGSEQLESLLDLYELIFNSIIPLECFRSTFERLAERIGHYRALAHGSRAAVVTIDASLETLRCEGMSFPIPEDGTRYDSIREYRRQAFTGERTRSWRRVREYRTETSIKPEQIVGFSTEGSPRLFEPLVMPELEVDLERGVRRALDNHRSMFSWKA